MRKKKPELLTSDDTHGSAKSSAPTALLSQLNWLNASDCNIAGVCEYPLYSDAHIISELTDGLGPYSFLNTVPPRDGSGIVNAPIILRAAIHLGEYHPDMSKTDVSLYHGGTLVDELAALSSVALGARIRAGGESRRFELGKDPYGRPCAWNDEPKPIVRVRRNRFILPSVVGTHSMDQLEILKTIPLINPIRYVNLVRACKSYQDALWVAESEPNLAWLMLVSALETAANDVYATDASLDDRLRDSNSRLAMLLENHGGAALVHSVAELIAPTLGATKKFIDFTMRFMPDKPNQRPEEWLQVKWSKTRLKKVLSKVYEYRSLSLHGGIPFPAPMSEPPFHAAARSPASEHPVIGLASHSRGGTWMPSDTPINLHCFHYIAHGVLLNWWRSMLNDGEQSVGHGAADNAVSNG